MLFDIVMSATGLMAQLFLVWLACFLLIWIILWVVGGVKPLIAAFPAVPLSLVLAFGLMLVAYP